MNDERRKQLLEIGVDPDFLSTYRGAFSTKHGRMPSRAEEAEAVRVHTESAMDRIHAAQWSEEDAAWARATMLNRTAMTDLRKRADEGDREARADIEFMRKFYEQEGWPTVDLRTGERVVCVLTKAKIARAVRKASARYI